MVGHAAERFELLASLERALDVAYARVRRAARHHWDAHFASGMEENAVVVVRVSRTKPPQPRAGHARRRLEKTTRRLAPASFAH